jgi:MFS family permease
MKEDKKTKISKRKENELKHHTRRLSIKEGIFWTIRKSFGDNYLAPFAIAIGTRNSLITILNSLWNLGPISQLIGAKYVGKTERKKIISKTIFLESIAWLIIAFTGILYLKELYLNLLPTMILIGLGIMVIGNGLGYPSWFSLMGDVVDEKFRGRWFSKRTTIISFTTIVLSIVAAFLLNYFKNANQEIVGFVTLFLIAAFARFYSIKLIKKHYDPGIKIKKDKKIEIKKFIKNLENTNFGKFILFRGIFAITIGLTTPLISIYLLRYLQFDYITYILIMMSGTLFSILTLNLWGKIADRYGNYKVIALTTILIPLTPLLWILSTNKIYLFLVPALIGGTSWTAFLMVSNNFIYDNIGKEKRSKAISHFNLFLGIGSFIGGLISALLLETIQTPWIDPLYLIFIISTITRMLVVSFWIPKIKEVTQKRKLKNFKELKKTLLTEAKPTIKEDLHEIMEIRKYIKER